jgi:hypothetical protein
LSRFQLSWLEQFMTMQTWSETEWSPRSLETPFAEAQDLSATVPVATTEGWNETVTPFAELPLGAISESEAEQVFNEALSELRDESFDEAVAFLAEETERAVADRFTGESPASGPERERFAEAYLSPIQYEAEQYLHTLEAGLASSDVQSLSDAQLEALLESFEPELPSGVTPAGEEFLGKLAKKAKSVVRVVSKVAKVAGKLATPLLGPVLKKLRGLVNPLLRRVLSFAIGRLPAALQPIAKKLATQFIKEAYEQEDSEESLVSPTNLSDLETVSESFDVALAEAISRAPAVEPELEDRESLADQEGDGRQLERLAEARGVLIDQLRDADEDEDLAPAIEQFVPALLAALKLGISLVGRPKVVSFLAKFLAKLIGKWVGPQLSGPLSNAIVDTGLRLISLEAETAPELHASEAGPVALAGVVEDTVRRFLENEDYVFEDESLTQLAAAEALDEAVATHFPQRFVRPGLQQAPSLGGTFVGRRPRRVRAFRKYSRVPEVALSSQVADELLTFGGTTVGQVLRAAGVKMPLRARVHIYQAGAGSTLPSILRADRRGYLDARHAHPLTPAAAGLLFREPRLGAAVPPGYLRSRQRIAVGQRFYLLEPLGESAPVGLSPSAIQRVQAQSTPSHVRTRVNLRRGRVSISIYLSESDAQSAAEAIRKGRGGLGLVQIVTRLLKTADRRLRASVLPAISSWVRSNTEAFVRAAAHPEPGVTLRVQLTGVPGLQQIAQGGGVHGKTHGAPGIAISVLPGRRQK